MKKIFSACLMLLSVMCNAQAVKDSGNAERRQLVFDSIDLRIIQRADVILADTSKWHKNDDRVCEDDIANGRFSLFCALYKASVDITGEYVHRRPCMQQVRFILEKYENGRVKEHRLMDWNNHPDTKFEEVKQLLAGSIAFIQQHLDKK